MSLQPLIQSVQKPYSPRHSLVSICHFLKLLCTEQISSTANMADVYSESIRFDSQINYTGIVGLYIESSITIPSSTTLVSSNYFSRSVADTSVWLGWTWNPPLGTSLMEVPWREVSVHRPSPEASWHDRMQPVAKACVMRRSLAALHPGFSHRPPVSPTCGETHNPIFPEFNFRTINPASVGGVDQYYFPPALFVFRKGLKAMEWIFPSPTI